jgi:hypothetical protein
VPTRNSSDDPCGAGSAASADHERDRVGLDPRHLPRSGALIVGDLVIGVPPGELSTYPDEVIDDKAELHRSAARLLDYEFEALLLCDGEPLPSVGKDKLRDFVERSASG